MKNLHSNTKQVLAISPVAAATGATTGRTIDRKGYAGVEFYIAYGAVTTSATVMTPIVYEGDAPSGFASAADADLIGTEALAALGGGVARASETTKLVAKRIGYKGNKRYVRLNLVGSGGTFSGNVAAIAVMHTPEIAPVSNP